MNARRQDLARPQDSGREEDRRSDQRKKTFSERVANGGWLLYTVEVLVLLVIFGWLFLTVSLAGG